MTKDYSELAALSGEASIRPSKYEVPFLKFNGNTGKFSFHEIGSTDKRGSAAGENQSLVFLKVRRTFTAYEKVGGKEISTFSNEHNTWRDHVILFQKEKGAEKASMVDEGNIKELRVKYPNIRLKLNIYAWMPSTSKIVKFGVKGKSLSSLFTYFDQFKTDHMFEFETMITSHTEESEGGLKYYVMDFRKGTNAGMDGIEPLIREVAAKLDASDKNYQLEKKDAVERMAETLPSVEYPEDDVNPDDIPF